MNHYYSSRDYRFFARQALRGSLPLMLALCLVSNLPGLIVATLNTIFSLDPFNAVMAHLNDLTEASSLASLFPEGIPEEIASFDVASAYYGDLWAVFCANGGKTYLLLEGLSMLLTPALTLGYIAATNSMLVKNETSFGVLFGMLRHAPRALLLNLLTALISSLPALVFSGVSAGVILLLPSLNAGWFRLLYALLFAACLAVMVFLIYGLNAAPYIQAEEPRTGLFTLLRRSWDCMRGRRMRLFYLNISFLGWTLLQTYATIFALQLLGNLVGLVVALLLKYLLTCYLFTANCVFFLDVQGKLDRSAPL